MTSFALVGEVLLGVRRRAQRTFSNQWKSVPSCDETRGSCASLGRSKRHWYRSLENPVESRSHFACQGSIIQRAPLMPGAASTVDSAQDLGESRSPRAIAVGADESGDLGEQRSGYRDNAKDDRNRRSYKIEREAN
jgi:hypothetical protein